MNIGKMNIGEKVTLEYSYGGYRMKVTYTVGMDVAQVSMYDLSKKLPLVWSKTMSKTTAHGCVTLFECIGYFDMPVDVH